MELEDNYSDFTDSTALLIITAFNNPNLKINTIIRKAFKKLIMPDCSNTEMILDLINSNRERINIALEYINYDELEELPLKKQLITMAEIILCIIFEG